MGTQPDRHRIGLEIEIDRDAVVVEPSEWDLDDLLAAVREGAARLVRVVRGRVIDEEGDLLSETLDGIARDIEDDLDLRWMASASPTAPLQPAPGSPAPSIEALVELRELADHARRVAARLRSEQL